MKSKLLAVSLLGLAVVTFGLTGCKSTESSTETTTSTEVTTPATEPAAPTTTETTTTSTTTDAAAPAAPATDEHAADEHKEEGATHH
jgi:hypothetical protein